MKNCVLLILLLSTQICFSQYLEPEEEKTVVKKNGIGIGLNPIVAAMLGASAEELHYGMQYRRLIANNRRLRVSGYYQWQDLLLSSSGPIGVTDSSLYKTSGKSGYDYFEIRAGMEWSDFTKSHDAFYGFDIIAGYDKTYLFKTVDERLFGINPSGSDIYGPLVAQDTINYYTDHSMILGLSPTFGYRVQMGNHLEMLAWLSTELVHSSPLDTDTHGFPQYHHNNSYTSFRLRLLDVVLSYRF